MTAAALRVIVITGGSDGIGAEMARQIAAGVAYERQGARDERPATVKAK